MTDPAYFVCYIIIYCDLCKVGNLIPYFFRQKGDSFQVFSNLSV